MTLLELMIAIAVLSIMLGIATLSFTGDKAGGVASSSITAQVTALRSDATTSGSVKTTTVKDSTGTVLVTALPDGRVVADMRNLDRMTGIVRKDRVR